MAWKMWRYDCYNLRMYKPADIDLFLDIGATAGDVFLMARILFPFSRVVGIEPCKAYFEFLKHFATRSTQCYNIALGNGSPMWFKESRKSGQHKFVPDDIGTYSVESKTLPQIFDEYKLDSDSRFILKCDCEGGERFLLEDGEQSLALIRKSMQFNLELHLGAWNSREDWSKFLNELQETHNIYLGGWVREGKTKLKYLYVRFDSELTINSGWLNIMAQKRFEGFPDGDLYYHSLEPAWRYYCDNKKFQLETP